MNILNNLNLKVISIGVAIFLWLFVVAVENYVYITDSTFPIVVENLNTGLIVNGDSSMVKIKYRSTDNAGAGLSANDVTVIADVKGKNAGRYNIPLIYKLNNSKYSILEIDPTSIDIQLEAIEEKEIPVIIKLDGQPAEGYEVKDILINPESIMVEGPVDFLANLTEITAEINLQGDENTSVEKSVKIKLPDHSTFENVSYKLSYDQIAVKIEIEKTATEPEDSIDNSADAEGTTTDVAKLDKKIMVQLIPENDLKPSVKEIVPSNVVVTVSADETTLASLSAENLSIQLKKEKLDQGKYLLTVDDVILPANLDVEVLTIEPNIISLKF